MRFAGSLVLVVTLGGLASPPADGQISFQRIIGTGDPLPGAPPGTTINYPFEAHAAGQWIAFGTFSEIGRGVYAWDGQTVHRVVDELMPVPGGNPTIIPYADYGMDVDAAGSVVIYGESNAGHGSWRWSGDDPIELVARAGDPSPTAPGETILSAEFPRVWGSTTYVSVERTGAPPSEMIGFPRDGPAFLATPPDFQVRGGFDAAEQLLYSAIDTNLLGGLWRADPGELPELLLAPGDSLSGGQPGETWIGGGNSLLRFGLGGAVFDGGGTLGTRGFFAATEPGIAHTLIRHGDPEPRTGLPILQLPSALASTSEHRFAFIADLADSSRHLSVREPDGTFLPILSTGDILDGEVVTSIWISTKAFANDNRLVAEIHRETDGAIWTIDLPPLGGPAPLTIPTSSPLALLILTLMLAVGGGVVLGRTSAGSDPRH